MCGVLEWRIPRLGAGLLSVRLVRHLATFRVDIDEHINALQGHGQCPRDQNQVFWYGPGRRSKGVQRLTKYACYQHMIATFEN
jgi:hypothetical protein